MRSAGWRQLTREEQGILSEATRKSLALICGDLQDGLLDHCLSQARLSDSTVESKIDCQPFDYRDILSVTK